MTTITPDTTALPTVTGISRTQVIQKLVNTGLVQVGTATSGDTESLTDTNTLKSLQYSRSDWEGGWLRISQAASANGDAPEGEFRPVDEYQPELGRAAVSPVFSATIDAGDTYELWRINPQIVLDIIDECLTDYLMFPTWEMLTEVPDGNFEEDNTDHWADVNATGSKVTTEPRLPDSDKRQLSILSSAANGYSASDNLFVQPGRTYYIAATMRGTAAGTTCKLIFWDNTNGVEIKSSTHTKLFYSTIGFNALIPTTCNSVSIRLSNVENSVTTVWNRIVFFQVGTSDISLPWWVKRGNQIKGAFNHVPYGLDATDLQEASLRGEIDSRYDVIPHRIGRSRYILRARYGGITWPVFIFGLRNEVAYANDNVDIRYIDDNLFFECIRWRIYERETQPLLTGVLAAIDFKAKLAGAEKNYRFLASEQADELNKILDSPTPEGLFMNEEFNYG